MYFHSSPLQLFQNLLLRHTFLCYLNTLYVREVCVCNMCYTLKQLTLRTPINFHAALWEYILFSFGFLLIIISIWIEEDFKKVNIYINLWFGSFVLFNLIYKKNKYEIKSCESRSYLIPFLFRGADQAAEDFWKGWEGKRHGNYQTVGKFLNWFNIPCTNDIPTNASNKNSFWLQWHLQIKHILQQQYEGLQWGRPGPGGVYWRDSAVTGQKFFDKMV